MATISEWWMWIGFSGFVITMLAIDLLLLGGGKSHRVSTKEALSWSIVWFCLALLFNLLLWYYLKNQSGLLVANEKALEFFTGYLIEKSLSVDNVFIFLMIFNYFAIPAEYQRRVLIYGVIGAVVMRFILILAGIWVISHFHWIFYVFGVFLMVTGVKMLIFADKKPDLAKNPIVLWVRGHCRVTDTLHGEQFFIRQNKLLYMTPLFLVLILIEFTDLIFAIDSIPAIFAITEDPFIVYTSNIFAIMGLRALYFLLKNMDARFHLLKYGLAIILMFVGFKMLLAYWVKIPIGISLGVVITILAVSMLLSIYAHPHKRDPSA
jgi:tellurite resistance protein TerC